MDDIQKTVKIDFSTGTNSTPETGICDCGGIFVFDTQRRIHICNKCKIIKRTVSKKQFQPGEIVADRYKILHGRLQCALCVEDHESAPPDRGSTPV